MTDKKSDMVQLVVRIPRESYETMKEKAEYADISINKFLNRAGSIVSKEDVLNPPWVSNAGVPPVK